MRLFLILILVFAAPLALAQRVLTPITLHYATPAQLVPVIKPYLSAGSTVTAYQNQLILNATTEELEKTRELLKSLDKAGRQLQISVRSDSTGSDHRQGVDVDSVIRSGNTVIRTGSGGRSIDSGNSESRTTIRVENHTGTSSGEGSQAVRATEGMPAYIATGMSAPVRTYTLGADGTRYMQQDYVNALQGFYATAWLNDNTVRVSIDQSNDQLEGRTVATQQLRSDVSGRLGEWLPIGTINTSGSQQTSGIGSSGRGSEASSTALYIKVEALD
jgi:type II/III secretion system protein